MIRKKQTTDYDRYPDIGDRVVFRKEYDLKGVVTVVEPTNIGSDFVYLTDDRTHSAVVPVKWMNSYEVTHGAVFTVSEINNTRKSPLYILCRNPGGSEIEKINGIYPTGEFLVKVGTEDDQNKSHQSSIGKKYVSFSTKSFTVKPAIYDPVSGTCIEI